MNFNNLIDTIKQTHSFLQRQSAKAVNVNLTIRNWLIGFSIVEFEQHGNDRAEYGEALLDRIAEKISIRGLSSPELSRCRQFYTIYPGILGTLPQIFEEGGHTEQLQQLSSAGILGTLSQEFEKRHSAGSDQMPDILYALSFSHFVELLKIEDPIKRRYYELHILKSQLSVRELKREIASLSYERLGLSKNKALAYEDIKHKIIPSKGQDIVKSHYFLEFLNINKPGLIEESELEAALIDNLQSFILELGNGFCFEARQKRILIGDEYFFVDLVFYHRILKCHVLIELKVDDFKSAHSAQLVTYLNYYKKNMSEEGDNSPIGILFVTDKNSALVEYATANDKDRLFVSKYKFNLPTEEELKNFIECELRNKNE